MRKSLRNKLAVEKCNLPVREIPREMNFLIWRAWLNFSAAVEPKLLLPVSNDFCVPQQNSISISSLSRFIFISIFFGFPLSTYMKKSFPGIRCVKFRLVKMSPSRLLGDFYNVFRETWMYLTLFLRSYIFYSLCIHLLCNLLLLLFYLNYYY